MTTDKEHLQWMLNRLAEVHGENRNVDYMMRMQQIIDNTETELNLHHVSKSFWSFDICDKNGTQTITFEAPNKEAAEETMKARYRLLITDK